METTPWTKQNPELCPSLLPVPLLLCVVLHLSMVWGGCGMGVGSTPLSWDFSAALTWFELVTKNSSRPRNACSLPSRTWPQSARSLHVLITLLPEACGNIHRYKTQDNLWMHLDWGSLYTQRSVIPGSLLKCTCVWSWQQVLLFQMDAAGWY